MSNGMHRYNCPYCKINIFGETTARLATNTNSHTQTNHPMQYSGWTAAGIIRSSHYSDDDGRGLMDEAGCTAWDSAQNASPSQARLEYTTPYGTTSKKSTPTEEELKWLSDGKIKW